MEKSSKTIGSARRVRVKLPLGTVREAWDCRAFGLGRVIAPRLGVEIEIKPGMHLHLGSGRIRSGRPSKRLAA